MDFGDLKDDANIQTKITNLHTSVEQIGNIVSVLTDSDIKDKLTLKEKTQYDIFMACTLYFLHCIYLFTVGIAPKNEEVQRYLDRIKVYIIRAIQVCFLQFLPVIVMFTLFFFKADRMSQILASIKKEVVDEDEESPCIKHDVSQPCKDEEEPAAKKPKI